MSEAHEELLNVYDAQGKVVGTRPRRDAKRSGLAVGAVNVLLVNGRGEVLLQRRPGDKENGGLWDKSVGGHVGAGEDFDTTAQRETGEELFDDAKTPLVRLVKTDDEWRRARSELDMSRCVLIRPVAVQLNLRDVRRAVGGGILNVTYHVGTYLGRTDVPVVAFHPQASEISSLRYAPPAEVDALLVGGELSPNMAFFWLTHARALLAMAYA
jgi:ADP-ribose pyrophosphatase YjhB (NUDIX family)